MAGLTPTILHNPKTTTVNQTDPLQLAPTPQLTRVQPFTPVNPLTGQIVLPGGQPEPRMLTPSKILLQPEPEVKSVELEVPQPQLKKQYA